jgi:predicted helicase
MLPSSLDHFHVKYTQNGIHAYEKGMSKAKHEMQRNYSGNKQTWVPSANDETIIYKSLNLSKYQL